MPLRAVIFDFDGVLVDTEPMHERAVRAAVEAEGLRFAPAEAGGPWGGTYIGLDDRDCTRLICAQNGREWTPELFERITARKRAAVDRALEAGEVRPFPGAVELVHAASRAGLTVAICSGARAHEIGPIVRMLGIAGVLATIVSADDVAVAKPDPAGYRLACARVGVEPAEAAAIEDSPRGIAAAVDAGLHVLAVGHSFERGSVAQAHDFAATIAEVSIDRLRALAHG